MKKAFYQQQDELQKLRELLKGKELRIRQLEYENQTKNKAVIIDDIANDKSKVAYNEDLNDDLDDVTTHIDVLNDDVTEIKPEENYNDDVLTDDIFEDKTIVTYHDVISNDITEAKRKEISSMIVEDSDGSETSSDLEMEQLDEELETVQQGQAELLAN